MDDATRDQILDSLEAWDAAAEKYRRERDHYFRTTQGDVVEKTRTGTAIQQLAVLLVKARAAEDAHNALMLRLYGP